MNFIFNGLGRLQILTSECMDFVFDYYILLTSEPLGMHV